MNIAGNDSNLELDKAYERGLKAGIREVVEIIQTLHLFRGDIPPKDGESYSYLGDHILRYGRNASPQAGFLGLSDIPEWQSQCKTWGIE